jgi:hypothetical protein
LSWSSFVQVLRGRVSSSVLVELFVLLIGSWGELHLIAYLLFWSVTIILRENGELAIILDDFITVQDFLNDLVIGSWVLEEWIIHLTSSCGVYSKEISSSLILENSFFQIFFIFEVRCFFKRLK